MSSEPSDPSAQLEEYLARLDELDAEVGATVRHIASRILAGDRELLRDIRRLLDDTEPPIISAIQTVMGPRFQVCAHCQTSVRVVNGRFVNHSGPDNIWCRDSGRPVNQT